MLVLEMAVPRKRTLSLGKQCIVLIVALLAGLFAALVEKVSASAGGLEFQKLDRPGFEVISLRVPSTSRYQIRPVVSPQLEELPALVNQMKEGAVAAINAGFFDPLNKETTSYVVGQGQLLANPLENRNFTENPELSPYIADMLNRSEFRVLECNGKRRYAIAKHLDEPGFGCTLIHSLQAGPNLFEPNAAEKEAFVAYKDNRRVRDPLGVDRKNARSAIGIDAQGDVIIAMALMKPLKQEFSGATLQEMADVMDELGAKEALSLDGGSSSGFWACGKMFYGKLDKSLHPVKRPIKSALVVIREE